MRKFYLAIILFAIPLSAARAADAAVSYPLWDGKESVASYAQRVNLPATKTIDLGKGVTMELVLIPAGKFVMGTPEPTPPEINRFESEVLMWLGIAIFVGFLSMLAVRKLQGKKVAFSMRYLIVITLGAGLAAGGYFRAKMADELLEKFENSYLPREEMPAHPETIVTPFYLGKFEVTQLQYETVMDENPCAIRGARLPVEQISWEKAQTFCNRLNVSLEPAFQAKLPEEAEWEYACRAGTQTFYYSGNSEQDLEAVGWYNEHTLKAQPVGLKKPNAFGLYDMHGNVLELCNDYYSANYKELKAGTFFSGTDRVARGGAYIYPASICRSATRFSVSPNNAIQYAGFRLMLTLTPRITRQNRLLKFP